MSVARVWQGAWIAIASAMLIALFAPAHAATLSPTTTVKWHATPVVKISLTPNYFSSFGAQRATTLGTPPPVQHGPDATGVGTGAVDFGPVLAGQQYIYRFAAHLNVITNDGSGFLVYGEGAANFYNQTDASSQPLNTTLYWLNSGATSSPNNGFSAGFPFQTTSGAVAPAQPNFGVPPTITYGSYPAAIASATTANNDYYYDYLLKVPGTATQGNYFVWVVYTVVAK